jgi:hypothetical protein
MGAWCQGGRGPPEGTLVRSDSSSSPILAHRAAGGDGAFEDNDLRGNYLTTWDIDPSSFGKVLRERNKD